MDDKELEFIRDRAEDGTFVYSDIPKLCAALTEARAKNTRLREALVQAEWLIVCAADEIESGVHSPPSFYRDEAVSIRAALAGKELSDAD